MKLMFLCVGDMSIKLSVLEWNLQQRTLQERDNQRHLFLQKFLWGVMKFLGWHVNESYVSISTASWNKTSNKGPSKIGYNQDTSHYDIYAKTGAFKMAIAILSGDARRPNSPYVQEKDILGELLYVFVSLPSSWTISQTSYINCVIFLYNRMCWVQFTVYTRNSLLCYMLQWLDMKWGFINS